MKKRGKKMKKFMCVCLTGVILFSNCFASEPDTSTVFIGTKFTEPSIFISLFTLSSSKGNVH